jgi:cytochrome c556
MFKKLPYLLKMGVSCIALTTTTAWAADMDPTDIIKYRRDLMESLSGHMGNASLIVQGKVSFEDQLLDHAKALQALTSNLTRLFPKGTETCPTAAEKCKTEAAAEIWTDWSDFEQDAKIANDKATEFLTAVESNDKAAMGNALKDLGLKGCKGCHSDYKKD